MADGSGDFEILDLSSIRRDRNWLNRLLGDVSRQSAAKQAAIGGVSGWCAGYLFMKVGKVAAATLGTTVLLVQIAQHQGYIKIDWPKVQQEMEKARRNIRRETAQNYHFIDNIQMFFRQNLFLAGGFAGGFLLGLAC